MSDNEGKINYGRIDASSSEKEMQNKIKKIKKMCLKENMIEIKEKDESAVFFEGIYYSQVPVHLLRDPTIRLQTKAVYALLHSYSQPKSLISKPETFVSQMKLAVDAGMSVDRFRGWIRKLEAAGWLTTKRRGLNKSNNYILHACRKKKK